MEFCDGIKNIRYCDKADKTIGLVPVIFQRLYFICLHCLNLLRVLRQNKIIRMIVNLCLTNI